jgi:hypothetical protein
MLVELAHDALQGAHSPLASEVRASTAGFLHVMFGE